MTQWVAWLQDALHGVAALPPSLLGLALAITAAGYILLAVQDGLALRYAGKSLSPARVALASFVAYSLSHVAGFAMLTGTSVRYRFWSSWGLTRFEIAKGVSFITITVWLGILGSAGLGLLITPKADIPEWLWGGHTVGILALAVIAVYLTLAFQVREPLRIWRWSIPAPSPVLALTQCVVSVIEWGLAAAVLYVLLPSEGGIAFGPFLVLFVIAQATGVASHVPGGLGIFDAAIVMLLTPYFDPEDLIVPLLSYRAIYYAVPFLLGLGTLVTHQAWEFRSIIRRASNAITSMLVSLAPSAAGAAAFVSGAVLLVSGNTPEVRSRMFRLAASFPLGIIELSHFAAAIAGTGLLLLALGLRRRIDAAYYLTVLALLVGIAGSLLKGLDYEETIFFSVVLLCMLPARHQFYRRANLLALPLKSSWFLAVGVVIVGCTAVGILSYHSVRYSNDLWWRFTLTGDASRFLRASIGSIALVIWFAVAHLLRPMRYRITPPTNSEIERAIQIARKNGCTTGNLAALGDKAVLLGSDGGMLMYAVHGRSWIALHDPIGTPKQQAELAWRFREMADQHGGRPVFYEVGTQQLSLYVDMGLSLCRIGEEGIVPLDTFTLDRPEQRALRRTLRDGDKCGLTFEMLPPPDTALIETLRDISNAWLSAKHTREKRFSLGSFDSKYLSHFPVAVVRHEGRIVAFANVWESSNHRELSIDLMRYHPDEPRLAMEYLLIRLILWGQAQGYKNFNLGMAPLAGPTPHSLSPWLSRATYALYRHGERFYNFQGIRQYKEKYSPHWTPKYLAYPNALSLPRVLADIAGEISQGLSGILRK